TARHRKIRPVGGLRSLQPRNPEFQFRARNADLPFQEKASAVDDRPESFTHLDPTTNFDALTSALCVEYRIKHSKASNFRTRNYRAFLTSYKPLYRRGVSTPLIVVTRK